jgi:hypothetical protein
MLKTLMVCLFSLISGAVLAQETPVISPTKASQLQRLEPLTPEKVDVFVESGQLTAAQAEYVKKHIGPEGQLALPEASVAEERGRAAREPEVRQPTVKPPAEKAAKADPYADFDYRLKRADQDHLIKLIRDYRQGNRSAIGRELRQFRPAVNALITQAYADPIDINIKKNLWEEVAGPANPDAAIGLFETHRAAYEIARPVLIAYEKDVGGLIVRRLARHPDANQEPRERWFSSRDMRETILEIEGLIARCSGPTAAMFLMDLYGQRYDDGEAPMRDKGRDRHRLVEACGGNPKKFEEGDRDTWDSSLPASARAAIAEHLIPWLHRSNGDRRKIAKNGLMICLPHGHPDWDDSKGEWERWWTANRERLMSEQ